jgi:methionyl-tRNA synthetase
MLHNQKISKSRNWYISLKDFIGSFNADYLRFYLASITPYSQTDINFDWDTFSDKINNELIANIGNFINRTLSFICKSFNSQVPSPSKYDEEDQRRILSIKMISKEVGSLISQNEFDKALRKILMFTTNFNQYFQKKKPWADKEEAHTTLYISVNAVRSLAILLQPYIPFSAEKIWSQLGFKDSVSLQGWQTISEMKIRPSHILGKIEPLFRKIERKEIDEKKLELIRRKNER